MRLVIWDAIVVILTSMYCVYTNIDIQGEVNLVSTDGLVLNNIEELSRCINIDNVRQNAKSNNTRPTCRIMLCLTLEYGMFQ